MPESISWQVESLRWTLFYPIEQQISPAVSLWETIVGTPPESRTDQPLQRVRVEVGQWGEGQLTVTVAPGRVDVVHAGTMAAGFPNLGEFNACIDRLRGTPSIAMGVNCIRLAFGAVLLRPVTTHEEAYSTLDAMLPGITVDMNSREFMYQINYPSELACLPGVPVNKLSRWSALAMHLVNFMQPEAPVIQFATRLELDINTSHEIPLSDGVDLTDVGNELLDIAVGISVRGLNA